MLVGGSDGSRLCGESDSSGTISLLTPSWLHQSARAAQFDVHYDTLTTSDPYRMVTRNSRIVAFALCPTQQVRFAISS